MIRFCHGVLGEVIEINVTQAFPAAYAWGHGSVSPIQHLSQPGEYIVTITTTCNEKDFMFEIEMDEDCLLESGIYIPNVFSPNGDQINDVFQIEWGSDLEWIQMTGQIFDRWGNLLYSTNEIPMSWDGYAGDKTVNPGVYVYRIKGSYRVGSILSEIILTGDVTVVR